MKRFVPCLVALSAACGSGPDPRATGGDFVGVPIVTQCCGDFVSGVALGKNGLYAGDVNSLVLATFDPPGVQGAPPTSHGGSQQGIDLASSADGTVWSAVLDPECHLQSIRESSSTTGTVLPPPVDDNRNFCGSGAPKGNSGNSAVYGLVADASAVYAVVGSTQMTTGPAASPDSTTYVPGSPTMASGRVFRIDRAQPALSQQLSVPGGTQFDAGSAAHVLAQNSAEVFWLDTGRVMRARKSDWATSEGRKLADAPQGSLVGIAADDAHVAWSAASVASGQPPGCWIWAMPATGAAPSLIHSGVVMCRGLAIDELYAYVAIVDVLSPPQGDPNSAGASLIGTGIMRVPLAGGAPQTVSLQSQRWYGPRRVLVDGTYVYAIDPQDVLRFPKTLFAP